MRIVLALSLAGALALAACGPAATPPPAAPATPAAVSPPAGTPGAATPAPAPAAAAPAVAGVGGGAGSCGDPAAVAKAQADRVGRALLAGDSGTVAELTHPKVLEVLGGRERMIATLEAGLREAKSRGTEIRGVRVGAPAGVVPGAGVLLVIVPTTIEMSIPGGRLVQESYLLGVSATKGCTWTFIDGAGLTDETIKRFVPDVPAQLTLPAKKKPTLVRER